METKLIGVLVLIAVGIFAGLRNWWTYSARMGLLQSDYAAYTKLPGYYSCFLRFWIWDISKF